MRVTCSLVPYTRQTLLNRPATGTLLTLLSVLAGVQCCLIVLLQELGVQAEHRWKQRQAPMEAYWCVVAVYVCYLACILIPKGGHTHGSFA